MPIYEYQCSDCGHELEVLQKMSDDPLTECPACQQHSLVKKISAAAFRLSGSGWYETDFKSGNKKNLVNSSGDDKTSSASTKDKAQTSKRSKTGSQSSATTSSN